MPRVRLFAYDVGSDTFQLPNHQLLTVRAPRLFARVRIGAQLPDKSAAPLGQPAIIDTGMPISVFPRATWQDHETEIEFLQTRSEAENGTFPVTPRILGCTYTFRLGRIALSVVDSIDDTALAERAVLARFLVAVVDQPTGANVLKHVVLGMSEGVLERRSLVFQHHQDETQRAAWIED